MASENSRLETSGVASSPTLSLRLLLTSATLGAVIAGLSFYLFKRYKRKCVNHTHQDSLEKLKCKLEKLKQAAVDAHIEVKEAVTDTLEVVEDNITDQLEKWTQSLKDILLTQDMQDAIGTIQFLLDKLMKFDMEAKSYEGITFILIALVKKAQLDQQEILNEKNLNQTSGICLEQFAKAKRFGQYAINMYPTSWKGDLDSIAERMGISSDAIIMVWFNDDEEEGHCPKFLLFIDHEVKSIVLAIRGTFCIKDAILDIVCDEIPFLDGHAHKGILVGARRIIEKVKDDLISSFLTYPDYQLIVTGHSLGAGTAELITLDLMLGRHCNITPPGTKITCIALAAPPVYRPGSSLPEHVISAIQIYINNYDCVPRLSLGSVARLLASMRAVDSLGLSLSEQLSILMERESENVEKNMKRLLEAVKLARQDKFPLLDHPGRIFHAQKLPGEETHQVMHTSHSQLFTEALLLLDNMILDHLHTSYETTFQNIIF